MTDTPRISFKRGDSFKLDITITDPNSVAALAAAAALVITEANYQAALDAEPVVPQDVIDTKALRDTDLATLAAAIIVDITGWTITSKLTWCNSLIATFVVTIINAVIGTLTITATPEVTLLWKEREHQTDIRFLRPSGVTSSETIIVDVERGATNG